MKGKRTRRILALAALLVMLCTAVAAEVTPLPLNILEHGYPTLKSGWGKDNKSYEDESIQITVHAKRRKPKSSNNETVCRWIDIKIADPTQLRTAMSNDSYEDPTFAAVTTMAKAANAVVALNGDFFKYNQDKGYVFRQGVFYRDALPAEASVTDWNEVWDSLIIDDRGDFHVVETATSERMADALKALEAEGRSPINILNFGPALVIDGQLRDPMPTQHYGKLSTQRIALVQLGELEYAVVEIDADQGSGNGMNLTELGKYILEIYPDCKVAYNLDGGGTVALVVNGKRIHKTPSSRAVSDIIYFASAQKPEE